jgi:hypothetical protein
MELLRNLQGQVESLRREVERCSRDVVVSQHDLQGSLRELEKEHQDLKDIVHGPVRDKYDRTQHDLKKVHDAMAERLKEQEMFAKVAHNQVDLLHRAMAEQQKDFQTRILGMERRLDAERARRLELEGQMLCYELFVLCE